ncbi:MAG TPA: ABC transporter permease, partial [Gemmatimonadaceae bacterium]|nr:ABC transporter permease [Gemmatimonadaceae bacterium]
MPSWIQPFGSDLKIAARRLRRAPTFALGSIAAIALGIGANATMFNVIDRLMLRPPARIAHPENVYTIHALPRDAISFPALTNLRGHLGAGVSVTAQTSPWELPVGRGDHAHMAQTVFADGGYFRTLGVAAAAGRLLSANDTRLPYGEPVAVISYGLWQRWFNRDPSVVGRELIISTIPVQIVGVVPEDFNGIDRHPVDIWLPLTLASRLLPGVGPRWPWMTADNGWLRGITRIAPQIDPRAVSARATALLQFAAAAHPTRRTATVELHSILPARAKTFSSQAKIASLLGAISILVFLIACSNATNLMLARGVRQRREIGMRVALGISR